MNFHSWGSLGGGLHQRPGDVLRRVRDRLRVGVLARSAAGTGVVVHA